MCSSFFDCLRVSKIKNRRFLRGFTILELMIVVIIVGVLASLAIPKFGMMIERSRATEAINILSEIRAGMERCYVMAGDYQKCIDPFKPSDFSTIGLGGIASAVNSHFDYRCSAVANAYLVVASRNNHEMLVSSAPADYVKCFLPTGGNISFVSFSNHQIALCSTSVSVGIKGEGIYAGIDTTPH